MKAGNSSGIICKKIDGLLLIEMASAILIFRCCNLSKCLVGSKINI